MQLRSNRRMAPTYCRTLTRGLFKTARGLRQRARVLSPPGRAVPSTSRRSCATTDAVCPPKHLGRRARVFLNSFRHVLGVLGASMTGIRSTATATTLRSGCGGRRSRSRRIHQSTSLAWPYA
jgi:hypothetical protein